MLCIQIINKMFKWKKNFASQMGNRTLFRAQMGNETMNVTFTEKAHF